MQRLYVIFKNNYLFHPGGCAVEDSVSQPFLLADPF
jgi:hypothetical protein